MNKQKWLIVGLSLAMAATLGVGISACGGDKDPDTPPTPTEHTHNYDAWDYDETQHWKYCDEHGTDKSNIDETTKANHSFGQDGKCECGYMLPEVYIEGYIQSHSTSRWWSEFQKAGDLSKLTTACIKMTRSEDGKTYSAEVYLTPDDRFAVYDYASRSEYPSGTALQSASKSLRVTEANTYLISWEVGSATPTFRVHDHKFEKYDYDGTNHWKVCTDQDATPDTTKTPHEFQNGSCVCGAKQACEHTNGSIFKYTEATLPEASAEGGTLKKYCPDCGEEVTEDAVNYTKVGQSTTAVELAVREALYARGGQATVSITAEQAGTYGFRLENVLLPEGFVYSVRGIKITDPTLSTTEREILNNERVWQTSGRTATTTAKWKEKITFDGGSPEEANVTALKEIKFTVAEEDLASGACKLTVFVCLYSTSTNRAPTSYPTCGIVITAFSDTAAAAASVQEVAMLPEKKD